MNGEIITADRLREIMSYDPNTGNFVWLVNRRAALIGASAGSTWVAPNTRLCYRRIKIGKRTVQAHRLAWLFVYGVWPRKFIDHIDGDGLNNSIANLREATVSENCRNRGATKKNSCGFKGVHLHRQSGKWKASIRLDGRLKHIGLYATPEAAHAAYCAAAKDIHGRFARAA